MEKITQEEILNYARIGLLNLIEKEEQHIKEGRPVLATVRIEKYNRQLDELWAIKD